PKDLQLLTDLIGEYVEGPRLVLMFYFVGLVIQWLIEIHNIMALITTIGESHLLRVESVLPCQNIAPKVALWKRWQAEKLHRCTIQILPSLFILLWANDQRLLYIQLHSKE